jgi:hypothetical protein
MGRPMDISDAVSRDDVTVNVSAEGPTKAEVAIRRTDRAPDTFSVVIPAGTLVTNPAPDSQQMVTATPIVFTFGANTPIIYHHIDLLCLNEFALPPVKGADLALETGAPAEDRGNGGALSTDALRRFMACTSGRTDWSSSVKQTALWVVENDYQDKTSRQVHAELLSGYRSRWAADIEKSYASGDMLDIFRQRNPKMSGDEARDLVDDWRSTKFNARVEALAERDADSTLDHFRTYAPQVLDQCGYQTTKLPLFDYSA